MDRRADGRDGTGEDVVGVFVEQIELGAEGGADGVEAFVPFPEPDGVEVRVADQMKGARHVSIRSSKLEAYMIREGGESVC